MQVNIENKKRMEKWDFTSSTEPGFHEVIIPDNADCKAVYIYRLNLTAGGSYLLRSGELEMHSVLINGRANLTQ